MNFDALKIGFLSYLENLGEENDKKYNTEEAEISIFMYFNEFKQYLKEESDTSLLDISTLSIGDLENLEMVNGQLVNAKETEENGETQEDSDANAAGNNENLITSVLNDLLTDENFKNSLDSDNNGTIDDKEMAAFFETLVGDKENTEEITLKDVLEAAQEITQGNAEEEIAPAVDAEDTPEIASGSDTDVSGVQSQSTSTPSSSGGNYNVNSGNNSGSTTQSTKNLEDMTEEELNSELNTAKGTLSDKQEKLSNILNDSDPIIQTLKDLADEAYESYQEQLKEVDEELAQKVDDLRTAITEKETQISEKEQEIADQEVTVSDAETAYNNAVATREGLESSLSTLESAAASTDDDEQKANIQAQITSVKDQITAAKDAETQAKDAWDDAEEKLDSLNDEKDELITGENGLDDLNKQMEDLEAEISEKYPEIQDAMDAYKDAQESYTTAKESGIESVKQEITEAQDRINDIQTVINTKKIEKANKENTSSISAFSQYNEERGLALANAALSLYGNDHVANGYCARGVSQSINKAFGYSTSGNGCDYGNVLSQRDDWVEVTAEIKSVEELKSLPAGAVVSWSTYEAGHTASNGRYGHVFISDGNGHEISDYIGNVSTNFYNWGASYRVFVPC